MGYNAARGIHPGNRWPLLLEGEVLQGEFQTSLHDASVFPAHSPQRTVSPLFPRLEEQVRLYPSWKPATSVSQHKYVIMVSDGDQRKKVALLEIP